MHPFSYVHMTIDYFSHTETELKTKFQNYKNTWSVILGKNRFYFLLFLGRVNKFVISHKCDVNMYTTEWTSCQKTLKFLKKILKQKALSLGQKLHFLFKKVTFCTKIIVELYRLGCNDVLLLNVVFLFEVTRWKWCIRCQVTFTRYVLCLSIQAAQDYHPVVISPFFVRSVWTMYSSTLNAYFLQEKSTFLSETKLFQWRDRKGTLYLLCWLQQPLFCLQITPSWIPQNKQPLNVYTIFVGYPGTGKYFF